MVQSKEEIEQHYREQGLETRYVTDKPGTIYEPHQHGRVYLFTLKGSAKIKLGHGSWHSVEQGQEIVIEKGQLHEAVVGKNPWEYIFAATSEEMQKQGL
jgi:mannose-6-phosphate isomerase-like protein (cupin superfamily)